MVGEVIAQFRVLVLIDVVVVAVFAGLFMQPRYVPREPALDASAGRLQSEFAEP